MISFRAEAIFPSNISNFGKIQKRIERTAIPLMNNNLHFFDPWREFIEVKLRFLHFLLSDHRILRKFHWQKKIHGWRPSSRHWHCSSALNSFFTLATSPALTCTGTACERRFGEREGGTHKNVTLQRLGEEGGVRTWTSPPSSPFPKPYNVTGSETSVGRLGGGVSGRRRIWGLGAFGEGGKGEGGSGRRVGVEREWKEKERRGGRGGGGRRGSGRERRGEEEVGVEATNCLKDLLGWFLVDLKFTVLCMPRWTAAWRVTDRKYTPYGCVHIEVFHVISRTDTISLSHNWQNPPPCAVRSMLMEIVHLNYLRFLSFLKRRDDVPCTYRIFKEIQVFLLFFFCRDEFPFTYVQNCIFLSSLRTRRCVVIAISCVRFPYTWPICSTRCFEYPQAFRRNRILLSRRTCRDSEGQVHRRRLWLCHDPCLPFVFLHPFRNRFRAAGQAEWNSESSNISWNGWCETDEEDCSTHHLWNSPCQYIC